ncbi:diguanylate cyclase [Wenzhouxiangella limi]|uniref:diguanylate cyclase n=1 Tax=Wenzhouxiangella limi TaxID=2707351 RepID=A0A845UVK9_9GAMM|nr:diguanylate cyclase [Wenzhouxiangella limi]NDY95863.1 diguanylate cyclase [Wenzhouxiangella limi]
MAVSGSIEAWRDTQSLVTASIQISLDLIDLPAFIVGADDRVRNANRKGRALLGKSTLEPRILELPAGQGDECLPSSKIFGDQLSWGKPLKRFAIDADGAGMATAAYIGHRLATCYADEACSLYIFIGQIQDFELLEQALELANLGVWLWDIQTEQVVWSEQVYSIFGLDSQRDNLNFQDFLASVRSKDRERVEKAIEQGLSTGSYDIEFEIRRPDKTYRVIKTRASVQFSKTGAPLSMMGTCQDLTGDRRNSHLLRRLVAVLDQSPDIVAVLDVQGRPLFLNEAGRDAFGDIPISENPPVTDAVLKESRENGFYKNDIGQFIKQHHPDWAFEKIVHEALPAAVKSGIWTGETAIIDSSGVEVPIEQHIIGHRDPYSGEILQFSTIMRDLRPQKHAISMLERINSLMNAVADSVSDAFWVRRGKQVLYANVALGKIFRACPDEICAKPGLLLDFFAEEDRPFIRSLLQSDLVFEKLQQRECVIQIPDRQALSVKISAYPCAFPNDRPGCVVTLVDITPLKETESALLNANSQLSRIAMQDSLTGIANRRALQEALRAETRKADRYTSAFSLILLDLDHFKKVNDQFGHDVGDQVLKSVTETVSARIRQTDIFGRWGGEEFLILLPCTRSSDAKRIAEALRAQVQKNPVPEGQPITASFGVAELKHGESDETLLKRADRALYAAKDSGRNRVCLDSGS